jgi:ketosteroid isomerase-like protein
LISLISAYVLCKAIRSTFVVEYPIENLMFGCSESSCSSYAIENRDGVRLANMYADDAVLRVIDRDNPPSKPREIRGKAAITAYWDDVCGRTMTHKVEEAVAAGDRLAFTQACSYPEGGRVLCLAMLELKGGKIAQQTAVQVWDE